jgi:hypothetical protein
MANGFDQIFGGSAVWPSNQTYDAITLSADTQLSWPIESVSSEQIVADLLDVTPVNQSGWNLKLPDATGGSLGVTMIISNLDGVLNFNVTDNALGLVVNVLPGTVWLIYLTDNSTVPGVWRAFQYGAQAGTVNVAAIAGSGLLAIGTSLNQSMPVLSKGTNYTVANTDRASVILWTGAAGTVTLPAPSGVGSNWFINIRNSGTGDLAVTPTSGLIDGAASKTFTSGTGSAIVFTDGTNYYTLGYGTAGSTSGFDYTTINAAGSDGVTGPITLAGGQLNRISYKVFGILTGNRSIIVPTTVQQYWIDNETTSSGGPWTLTIKTAAQVGGVTVSQPGQAIMYCDGANVQPAVSGISLPVAIASGGTGATTAAAARTNLGSTATGDNLFTSSSASAARGFLGSGATGDAIFVATTASIALTALAGGTMTGGFTATTTITAGGISVTAATAVANGINLRGASSLGFRTNSIEAGFFDSGQNLQLTHPLGVAFGGTAGTTAATARTGIGLTTMDSTATVNTIAQRTAAADLLVRLINCNFAQDNFALSSVIYEQGNDGYYRKMTPANFGSKISPFLDTGTLVAGATGHQIFTSGLVIQWGSTGNIGSAGGVGDVTVNFGFTFPTACFKVFICETNTFVAGSAQAASRAILLSASQFKVQNNSNGTQAFFYFAIGN